ncbi:MAG: Uma2 family endonuclease, partial [Pirellulales bacterium]
MSLAYRPHADAAQILVEGQRLDQPAFHALYEQMPPPTRAELIGGVVSMPSPLGSEHGDVSAAVVVWLGHYAASTPGVRATLNTSTVLGPLSEVQPDASLRILEQFGGQTRTDPRYLVGAPELVVEVARSSRYIDLGPKLWEYGRGGVREYVVVALDPYQVFWFIRGKSELEPLEPGADGLFRSAVFPGLWLDPKALGEGNLAALRA